ncbi:MAG: SLBB domain-containing protein [Microcoleus vaginatus WJT46-NPBG5]|nr:SLBB domain-containing protein [Microcoleus vaginatus WJT46-NPBG5]
MHSPLATRHWPSKPLSKPFIGLTVSVLIILTHSLPSLAQGRVFGDTTPSQLVGPSQLREAYILGPADVIQIDIFNVPEYSGENGRYQVLVDGSLNLPLIGRVDVQGLTLQVAAQKFSQLYAEYLTRPIVTVSLLQARPLSIGLAGEVNRPGSYVLGALGTSNTEAGAQVPTVTRAIQNAGGITQSADLRRVQLRRPQPSGGEQIINLDLKELLQTGDLRQDLTLRDGDTIFIPTQTNVNLAEASQLSTTTLSGDSTRPLNIAVVGEVNRPGSYTMQRVNDQGAQLGLVTVTRALQTAGGITQLADIRRVEVRRNTKIGTEQVIDIDLWQLLQAGDLSQDVILDQGDTIVVPTAENIDLTEAPQVAAASFSPGTITVNVVGEVVRSGAVALPPNTSLNQALLAAGGFNNIRARRQEVELVRLNPNGTVSRRVVPVDFSQELNEETNPALRPNDVIVVGRSGITKTADTITTILSPFVNLFGAFRIFDVLF